MLDKLKARRDELRQEEARAIHGLGFVAGRLQEIEEWITELESGKSGPTVERAGKPVEVVVDNTKTEKR